MEIKEMLALLYGTSGVGVGKPTMKLPRADTGCFPSVELEKRNVVGYYRGTLF